MRTDANVTCSTTTYRLHRSPSTTRSHSPETSCPSTPDPRSRSPPDTSEGRSTSVSTGDSQSTPAACSVQDNTSSSSAPTVGPPKRRIAWRIGFDDVVGAVDEIELVLVEHPELAQPARRLHADDVRVWLADDATVQVIDIRNPGETRIGGTIRGAQVIPLPQLLDRLDEIDPTQPTIVYCAGGYRSSIAASFLRANGFAQVADIIGGYGAWTSLTTTPKDSHV